MDKIAVVTGAAQGIGLAITTKLIADGFRVVGIDINGASLAATASTFADRPNAFVPLTANLTDADAVADTFATIAQQFDGVDVLVNNAGTCLMDDFVDITPTDLKTQMAINFESAFYCCQQAIPLMLKRPGIKKIVNISSNGAYNFEVFDPAHYRASKAAMDTMTKHLARRYAKENIVVNSIAPAMTRTDLFDVVSPELLEQAISGMPQNKPMEPTEVAAWVAFLASPAGNIASGNVIILNQGRDVR